VSATRGLDARSVLDLGTGTGETAARVLAAHPRAHVVGVDSSEAMLEVARRSLDARRVTVRGGRLEDPADAVTPLSPDYDLASTVEEQLSWLEAARFEPAVTWRRRDLALLWKRHPCEWRSPSAAGCG
jgi:tRNA (cmo5U34)-methyltransferase